MAKISYSLDERKGAPKVKMSIFHDKKTAMISMGITLDYREQWTGELTGLIVGHPLAATWNRMLTSRLALAMEAMYQVTQRERYTLEDIKIEVQNRLDPSQEHEEVPADMLIPIWRKFMQGRGDRTFELYHETLGRIQKFVGGEDKLSKLRIEHITLQWLDDFDHYLAKTRGVNSRAIDMRNLRAVCMYAWKYDLTEKYVFKRWKIEKEDGDIHPLSAEQFARFFSFDLSGRSDLQMYRDIALLGFFMIGCNVVDMHGLTKDSIENGYIKYRRAKTHRRYCIKIEPEVAELLERYKGEKHLLAWADRYRSHKDFTQHLNDALKKVGPCKVETIEGSYHGRTRIVYDGLLPNITYYQLRHTWACFAADLDIPKDTIALCLGHGKKTVTDVYVQYDQRKIDDANRKVIDYALGLMRKMQAQK